MPRFALLLIAWAGLTAVLRAQTPRDFAVDLKADVSAAVPHITLSWSLRQAANITAQQVYRRLKGEVSWGTPLATLSVTDTTWADATATPGVEYEYWMRRTYTSVSPTIPTGYISAGYELPMVENRGKLVLLVDDTMVSPLVMELQQLRRDLVSDGWAVQTIPVARRDTQTDVTAASETRALVKAAYDADPVNVKMVYILGHVPVPYSGSIAPDGHGDHIGAWPADGYYAEMDGTWTDSTVTSTSGSQARNHNIPGDGKLDQGSIPGALELGFGRVTMRNMQRSPSASVSETSLLRRYLNKAHDFKRKQGAYASLQRRVLLRDGFGNFSGESFMRTGWAWGFTTIGRPPEVSYDEAPSGNWWALGAASAYLMANGNGGGSYETCSTVGASVDFGRRPFRAAFMSLFGSYFGDWDSTNNFMRAPLAGNAKGDGLGLTCFWAGRPTFFMHHMATGDTIGYSIRRSISSQQTSLTNPAYTPAGSSAGGVHLGLMGDPSLRMHVVEPPRNFTATSASGAVQLAWASSTESSLLGYHVYRADTSAGPFARLTASPLGGASYNDVTGTAGNSYTYMVRTLKMENTPGGSYQNLSLGSMIEVEVSASASGVPRNPSGLTITQNSSTNVMLSWQDNATDETGFRVERKNGAAGAFASLTVLGAGVAGYLDAGPFIANEVYYYRIIAINSAGDSAPSDVASFEAVPGYFEFDDTLLKVTKSAGVAQIPVKRFGGVHGAVSVSYATSNSSAIAGTHYTTGNGTVSWADGETGEKMIPVVITNTPSSQHPRQFRVTLSSPSSGTGIGTYNAVSVLIEDASATLPTPWSQSILGALTDSSPAVQAEGGISSTTVGGSGLATAATSEAGQFVYQMRSGDGVMTAQVAAASPAQTGARYAVMIRASGTTAGAAMAGVSTSTSTSEGTKMISRASTSATASFAGAVVSLTAPRWLRITRAGDTFTAESSPDGTAWASHGTVTVPMSASAAWGLFHHSDDRNGSTHAANFQMVPFQNISFTTLSGPGAPGTLSATVINPNRVTLTWGAASLAAGYRIERRDETGAFRTLMDVSGATLSFNDDSAAANSGYEYRVHAFNASGNSPVSNTVRVATTTAGLTLLLPSDTSSNADATVRGDNATGNFGDAPTLRAAGNDAQGQVAGAAKSYLRFDLSGLPTLSSASLRLTVASTSGLASTGFNGTIALRALNDGNDGWTEGALTWNNAPLNNTSSNGFLTGTTLLSSYTFSPITVPSAGSVIMLDAPAFTLDAMKGADNLITLALHSTTQGIAVEFASKEHPSLAAPMLQVSHASSQPVRPTFLTVVSGTGSDLNLSWSDNSTSETGFEVQRRPASGTFTTLVTTAPDALMHSDNTTAIGTSYEYRVRAVTASGHSAWSPVVAATAGGSTSALPDAPHGFAGWMSSGESIEPSQSEPAGDNDLDGVPNLVEYVQGTPAGVAGPLKPVLGEVSIGGSRYLTLTFQRRVDVTDVSIMVEAASAVTGPWVTIDPLQPENQVERLPATPAEGWETLTVRDVLPLEGTTRRYLRMAVIQR